MTLNNLAIAYGSLGDPKRQKELLERALKIEEAHYGQDHFEVAMTLNNLANAYGSLGDPERQTELLERALKICEAHYGQDYLVVVVKNLGMMGRWEVTETLCLSE